MFKFFKKNKADFLSSFFSSQSILDNIDIFKKKRRKIILIKIFKKILLFFLLGLLLLIISLAYNFYTIKNIYSNLYSGKNNIEESINLAKIYKFEQAIKFANNARENFSQAGLNLEKLNTSLLSYFPIAKTQFRNLEYITNSAQTLSKAASEALFIAQSLKYFGQGNESVAFANFSREQKIEILKNLYQATPELSGIKANLDLSLIYLNYINFSGLSVIYQQPIDNLKNKINFASETLGMIIPMVQALPVFSGYPEQSNFLFLLQNNDELRPTGGFIGTYGIAKISAGDILSFDVHDIYHLDMPAKDKVTVKPPMPLVNYLGVDKWFVRDANWSPDWPTSATQIETLFLNENKYNAQPEKETNFSAIIAITPKLVTDLLALTGPITIEGVDYNKDNFVDLLQYRVEKGYVSLGISSWQRKEVIGEIMKELKIKIFNSSAKQWENIFSVITENFFEKNILIFSRDKQFQEIMKNYGYSGEIKQTQGDYLMVVDANMASLKTDSVMQKNINYQLQENFDGVYVKLTINYFNQGNFSWKTTRYRTYTRVYVPQGSRLITSIGSVENKVEIYEELGKTVFATFAVIEPGTIGSLYFEYKLPENIKFSKDSKEPYQLLLQKQPGNNVESLIVDLKFINKLKSYNPIGFFVQKLSNDNIRWTTNFNTDKIFQVEFK